METTVTRRYDRIAACMVTAISLLISLLAAYVKAYFWGGTDYASMQTKLGFWFVIVAGPLSLSLAFRKPHAALAVAIAQFIVVAAASV